MTGGRELDMVAGSRESFVESQLKLLELEYDCELEKTRQYQSSLSIIELVREGVCMNKLRCSSVRTGLFLRTLITFESTQPTKALPSHRITVGDIVSIQNGNSRESVATGVVYSLSSSSICIAAEKESQIDLDTEFLNYAVVKISNNVTHRRLKKALRDLRNYPVGGRAHSLVEVIFGNREPSEPLTVGTINFFNTKLNESQKQAVKFALSCKELAIIHGPPGTGKTTTLVELILQLRQQGLKILVCTPSNVAIDNLVEKLAAYKVRNMVRLGHPARASSELQRFTLDAAISRSEVRDVIDDIRMEIDGVRKSRTWNKRGEIRDLMKDLKNREQDILKSSLYSSDVILSTLTSASPEGPLKHLIRNPDHHPDVLVIDECSQALEAACWIAIPSVRKCILAGDHHQLPPTIISSEAAEKGLEVTLMEKCLKRLDQNKVVRMLTIQYRMHQSIMEWSSKNFYSGQLIADDSVRSHTLEEIAPSMGPYPSLLLLDTAGCDMKELDLEDEESKGNESEADIVAAYVTNLIEKGVNPSMIGIITPYNLQVELLRLRLSEIYPSVEIRSVDGFQGREKEVIILCLVRSNEEKQAGFLSEYRRINVAVTRAKRHLAVICDSETVSSEPHLESLVQFLHEKGEVKSAFEYESQVRNYAGIERPQHLRFKDRSKKSVSKPAASSSKAQSRSSTSKKKSHGTTQIHSEQDKVFIQIIRDKIKAFAESRQKELVLPSSMTSFERRLVHKIAEELGLVHSSVGEGEDRHLVVRKVTLEPEEPECSSVLGNKEKNEDVSLDSVTDPVATHSQDQGAKKKKKRPKIKKEVSKENRIKKTPQTVTSEPKQWKKLEKKEPLTKAQDLDKKLEEVDEFDEIMELVQKIDGVCFYIDCKTKTRTLGQDCQFCRKRFCFSHSMPEIHGCGDAVRKHARSMVRREGRIYPGSGAPNHKPDPVTRANLEKKLNKKLEEIIAKRKPQPKKNEELGRG